MNFSLYVILEVLLLVLIVVAVAAAFRVAGGKKDEQ